ncbi:hypothetical protein D1627_08660 [Pontibacter oryzae]|uniref:Peptidase M48 domain-containing protein n=1 Tax=Pontibacter oryzae TaxID=2304593 RepID=A0A399SDA1_9BACT|nr:hypothetical protein D1627_08660 [Pontibacter oryzae]
MPFFLRALANCKVLALALALLLGAAASAVAQNSEIYPFYTSDKSRVDSLATVCGMSIERSLNVPNGVKNAYRNTYKAIIERTAMETYGRVRTTALLDTVLEPFVQSVFQTLKAANPSLHKSKVILTRSPLANAYALADGTVFINIGLLAKLSNEAQLAFILSHELAHVELRHMQAGIEEHLDLIFSKEFKKEYKKVAREKYNRTKKMEALLERVSLNTLYHKRSNEMQADSLGFRIFANTQYNQADAYTALELLDTVDEPLSTAPLALEKYFSCEQAKYNFDEKQAPSESIFEVEKEQPKFANSDSLKTHPDCQKRMAYLRELSPGIEQRAVNSGKPTDSMQRVNMVSRIELVQSWFDFENYDFALFEALLLLEKEPASIYARNMVTLSLYGLKRLLQAHTFSEAVSTSAPQFSANINMFLDALNNLNTSDFKGFAACFSQKYPSKEPISEFDLAASYTVAELTGEQDAADQARLKYQSQYSAGRFFNLLFSEQPSPH